MSDESTTPLPRDDNGATPPSSGPEGQNQPYGQQGSYQQGSYEQGTYQQGYSAQAPGYTAGGDGSPTFGGSEPTQPKGLVGSLFDFSFRHFATPHIVRIVYIIATVLLGLGLLVFVISALAMMTQGNDGVITGILMLVAAPLAFLFYLALLRMSMEMYVALTRMADDMGRIREELRRR